MITKTELSKMWEEIVPQQGQNIGRRADPNHPLDFFITYDEKPNMQLMLLTDYQLKLPVSSKQIFVRGNKRADGKNAVCFSLEDKQLKDQFVSLCWDIMDCTYEIQNKKVAAASALKRFKMWQKLFAEVKTKKLSETEAKGLLGELIVLKEICAKKYGIEKAIACWIGPLGADRDFEYEDVWYESKFVSLSMDKVKISSLDQLDIEQRGYLVLSRFEKTSDKAEGFITLNMLVNCISDIASENENALVSFKNRLALSGYKQDSEHAEQPYMFHRFEAYEVSSNDFPRLKRSEISASITDAEYQLSIPAIQQWKTAI